MKIKHQYTERLENFLIHLNEDELIEWFQDNTIQYEVESLLEVIKKDLENETISST